MNGKQVRNAALEELLAWLWLGKVERAILYLRNLSNDSLKN
jgi:hypothetical protein